MIDRTDPLLDSLRRSFDPDPAAVSRVVEGALGQPRRALSKSLLAAAVTLSAAAAMVVALLGDPPDDGVSSHLSNSGEVYVSRSSVGIRIHNNPPAEGGSFRIFVTGVGQ